MLLDQTTFTRDELCRVLRLTAPVIDALLASGAVHVKHSHGERVVNGADLERLFSESLLLLYQAYAQRQNAVAVAEAKKEAVEPEQEIEFELEQPAAEEPLPPPVIVRTSDEHEPIAAKEDSADLRLAARYMPRRQLAGMFRDVKVQVLQLSNTGLRIRHSEALRPGEDARLSIALPQPQRSFVMRARIVWTSIAQSGDGPSFFISGLRVTANSERLSAAVDLLRSSHDLQLAPNDDRRRKTREVPRVVNGLADEDVAAIIRAVRKFAADPAEATRWYTRARFAVADENIRKLAPRGGREREEVLGVWEYLQRRVDIAAVAGVMRWIRSSQAHA